MNEENEPKTPPELAAIETPPTLSPLNDATAVEQPIVVTPPEAPKKKSKKLLAIILVVVFVILAGGGASAYFLLGQKPATKNETSQTATTKETAPAASEKLTAKALVDYAKTDLTGDVQVTQLDTDKKPYTVAHAPNFKPTGYDFWVNPSVDYGFGSYGTKATIAADLATLKTKLTAKGLTETLIQAGTDEDMYVADFESDDIICSLTDLKPYKQPATSTEFYTLLGCADKDAYLANAAELKPYFVVYAAQTTFDTTKTFVNGLTTAKSKTAGYSTAQVAIGGAEFGSVGGFAGLFYTTPDNKLHYFVGTQSQLLCSAYNTDDLKKAYLGETCYDTDDKESTVKL